MNTLKDFLSSPKKILVLEDEQYRIDWMQEAFAHHNVTYCLNAKEAYDVLEHDTNWDVFFLDHDLADEHYQAHDEMTDEDAYYAWQQGDTGSATGFDVACYIQAKSELRDTLTIVHSMNPTGAEAIEKVLSHAVRIPFGYLQKVLTTDSN